MSGRASSHAARVAITIFLLWALSNVGSIVWRFVNSPIAARKAAHEARLQDSRFAGGDVPTQDSSPRKARGDAIVAKGTLWKGVVDAPPPVESAPDLGEQLKTIVATKQQIVRGDAVNIKIRANAQDRQGRWMAVGDTLNGLTLKEIKPDAVVFGLQQNGKEYTAEVRRK